VKSVVNSKLVASTDRHGDDGLADTTPVSLDHESTLRTVCRKSATQNQPPLWQRRIGAAAFAEDAQTRKASVQKKTREDPGAKCPCELTRTHRTENKARCVRTFSPAADYCVDMDRTFQTLKNAHKSSVMVIRVCCAVHSAGVREINTKQQV